MQPLARSIIIIDFLLSLVLVTLLRLSKRIILESGKRIKYKNTLIIGANSSVNSLLNDKTNKEYSPLAIVDGNEILIGTYISNIKVFGFKDLKKVIHCYSSSLEMALEFIKINCVIS
jgi:UDP-N-acetyl-D-glucosamine 4,6-dehydratase